MSITIKDIAKLANVSHTTVSRALNDSPLINEETKKKIKIIASQLKYIPNYNAKNLVLHKSNTIGLFFSSINQGTSPTFFFQIIKGVNSIIKEDYNLVVRGIDTYKDFTVIDNKRFDGIILMSQSDNDNAFIYHILQTKIPLVVLNREMSNTSLVNILSDDRKGAFKAVEYLIENGHRDIAIIEGKEEFKSSKERKEGYIEALMNYKIPLNVEYIVKGNYDMESGYQCMKKLIKLEKMPTSVFCSNDDMAIGAIKAVNDSGFNVPQDISIIGFDDIDFCKYTAPALTTVKRPMEAISILGSKTLLDLLNKKTCKNKKLYINTELVIRDSVRQLSEKI
ncbi:LacI family DNA-binding transcriptional regulator [Clostridium tyrobutyricum]|uniref:LacI family DNA-binding transcriptional regulator n=1 Tax=Clostridium tyrobutyricum TaxID=1519 RepID=UPI001C38E3EF|nr:LacI family DNA-binding transcriptional regulator [Clostridium tyrobutyricum]MBV4438322.1 LacI family transcriptional regulator [Clostridium tyrobutyricum]MBV4440576.1 LacI family transcriptional regulator [Clostridium tyrobutyricum]